jgi:hypothetical protein
MQAEKFPSVVTMLHRVKGLLLTQSGQSQYYALCRDVILCRRIET